MLQSNYKRRRLPQRWQTKRLPLPPPKKKKKNQTGCVWFAPGSAFRRKGTQANGMSSGTKCCLMPRNGPHWPRSTAHGAGSRCSCLLAWADRRTIDPIDATFGSRLTMSAAMSLRRRESRVARLDRTKLKWKICHFPIYHKGNGAAGHGERERDR